MGVPEAWIACLFDDRIGERRAFPQPTNCASHGLIAGAMQG